MTKPNSNSQTLPPIASNTPNYNSGSTDTLSGSLTNSLTNKSKNNVLSSNSQVGFQKTQRKMKNPLNKDLNSYTPFSISNKTKQQLKKQNYWSTSIDYDSEPRSPIVSFFLKLFQNILLLTLHSIVMLYEVLFSILLVN